MTHRNDRSLRVGALSRVEGEGAMHVRVRNGEVADVQLEIYEPPRFFEALLRGRSYLEPPDITARICGICPVAYQMSACQAIEDACEVSVDERIQALRRLLYCGEWIESHVLHIYLLHAPDFLGYQSAIEMAADHRDLVERGLALKKLGNDIMEVIGGRAIHPINVKVGGFFRAPAPAELRPLGERLLQARDAAIETVQWVAGFDFPDFHHDHEMLAMTTPGRYPIESGSLISTGGLAFPASAFEDHVVEEQVPHSTALHAHLVNRDHYLVGPAARYTLNSASLSPMAREVAHDAGLGEQERNPFRGIIVRAVEVVYAIDEALRLIDGYQPPAPAAIEVPPHAGVGYGITEAPRGVLYHRYELDAAGLVTSAKIVPPTSQNQASIEHDLTEFVSTRLSLPDDQLQWECEQAIRNYDPCISCSAHFLDFTVERS
ncbi:Ni/Fe hydrogenase subunit alpha [Phytoactinopolyspora limicola]|uniref:Ni/Fe hydrogenase subunit alpha n=1 Tax=Phytoactinopolyspora limicola TaxID=2715536 RepID=UPI00140BB7E5|nr:Ni/Fe hydrogenase subunit alpha [Phytoactinopolyspora limicola]